MGLGVVVLAVVVLAVVASVFGTTTLVSPEDPRSPRVVFVIDHGRHSSIAVETQSGTLVRYAYGDTRYYRDQDTSLLSGAAALLWPTEATLGRAELSGEATLSSLSAQLVVGVEEILVLHVAGDDADALSAELDRLHTQGLAEHVFVGAYGLVFAPHPRDYVWWHNSSTVVAAWLEDMGVEVRGLGLLASWDVVRTEDPR